ncbi:MAG: transcription termination factor NusA, partial [Burkholderiales bacterium]
MATTAASGAPAAATANKAELLAIADSVAREKLIDRAIVIEAMEDAIQRAARARYGAENDIRAKLDPVTGDLRLWRVLEVVEEADDHFKQVDLKGAQKLKSDAVVGDFIVDPLPPIEFGRIAAQAAKQNIIQRVREAERTIIYNEFKDRKDELFSGIVQRFERKNIIVNLGRTDAILPEKEQVPRERYRQGDRIRAYIVSVEITSRGPQIVLSRTHPGMLIQLFAQEVPEIYEGIVEVKGAAREPGGRAKIAVISHDLDVDPVGACVGMKGTRVQSVVQELRGEKIDIVHWIADQAEYVCRSLAPAKVAKIIIDDDDHTMQVVVPDDQLSLAIGRKGQNVRLAARLTGWRIDVCGEAEAEEETRRARQSINSIPGIGDMAGELLYQEGFKSAEDVADSDLEDILDVEGISKEKAEALH